MVDFSKKLKEKKIEKSRNPIEIYDSIDRKSVTGPLRPAQVDILEKWYNNKKDENDLIIKLHTGAGKTLIGLLILQSKLNSNEGPCIYICPNIYLVNQVCEEAMKFGINYCCIGENNELPDEFILGKSILITYVQKVFNGKSIFGLNNNSVNVGCVIMDDSHACIDAINNSFTINIERSKNKDLYDSFFQLFEEDLIEQGAGTVLDIKSEDYESLLPIPYWAWDNKNDDVLKLLSENKRITTIEYVWPLLKNSISKCKAYISGKKIEISPYTAPIKAFGTFSNAKNRILMSATTQNDSFFVKGLNFNINSIRNPLVDTTKKWSGEKMILIPSLIDERCDRGAIIEQFAKTHGKDLGIVALVPSFKIAEVYEKYGADKATSKDIYEHISNIKLKGMRSKTLVIANRYDGIDLPDDACRILIIDSLPFFDSLSDRYQEICRTESEIINIKIAQKIEQGLGRSVRGEKDFSAILLIGTDLVKFAKSSSTKKYFSVQTQRQIDIGIEIASMAKEEVEEEKNPIDVVKGLIKQSLHRDESWKEYYSAEMNNLSSNGINSTYDILVLESKAEQAYNEENYERACEYIQKIIDSLDKETEKGWYLQELARYKYFLSKVDSNRIQQRAFKKNLQLLKPRDGISYKKIEYINGNRINRIKSWLNQFNGYDELILHVDNILDNCSFGRDSEKFESALKEIGELLGFESQRPDKMIRKGPDNLWCVQSNTYIMFECKSEVKEDRIEISKYEAGQMNSHCGWFKDVYGDAKVKNILVIPTKNLSYYANFTHQVTIMRKGKLRELKANIKNYIKEFKAFEIKELTDEKIQEFINVHKLGVEHLMNNYCEDYHHKNK